LHKIGRDTGQNGAQTPKTTLDNTAIIKENNWLRLARKWGAVVRNRRKAGRLLARKNQAAARNGSDRKSVSKKVGQGY
jgi:hypothetical protein